MVRWFSLGPLSVASGAGFSTFHKYVAGLWLASPKPSGIQIRQPFWASKAHTPNPPVGAPACFSGSGRPFFPNRVGGKRNCGCSGCPSGLEFGSQVRCVSATKCSFYANSQVVCPLDDATAYLTRFSLLVGIKLMYSN